MTGGRIALLIAVFALGVGGIALWAAVSGDESGVAPRLRLLPQQESSDDGRSSGTKGGSGNGLETGDSGEATGVPNGGFETLSGKQVPDETVYELVDALKAAGILPVMGSSIVVEYAGRLDAVRVSGRFEGTEETTLTLENRDGIWRLKE